MPVTGNNIRTSKKIVSIRLSAGGLSFWNASAGIPEGRWPDGAVITDEATESYVPFGDPGDTAAAVGKAVERAGSSFLRSHERTSPVLLDTPKTVLVPQRLYDPDDAGKYLAFHGLEPAEGERVYVSDPVGGTVAVMAANGQRTEALKERTGDPALISPLQYNLMLPVSDLKIKKGVGAYCAAVHLAPSRCYVSLFLVSSGGRELVFCDHYPYAGAADLLYYLGMMAGRYPGAGGMPVILRGHGADKEAKAIGKYHRIIR